MDECNILCVTTVDELQLALKTYHEWVMRDKCVYAVDKSHYCSKPLEYDVVKKNKHQVLKLILFDHLSYYAIKKMDRVVREEIPGSHIRFRCPLCHEGYGSLWYPLVQYQ